MRPIVNGKKSRVTPNAGQVVFDNQLNEFARLTGEVLGNWKVEHDGEDAASYGALATIGR